MTDELYKNFCVDWLVFHNKHYPADTIFPPKRKILEVERQKTMVADLLAPSSDLNDNADDYVNTDDFDKMTDEKYEIFCADWLVFHNNNDPTDITVPPPPKRKTLEVERQKTMKADFLAPSDDHIEFDFELWTGAKNDDADDRIEFDFELWSGAQDIVDKSKIPLAPQNSATVLDKKYDRRGNCI
jgi:hypothetical protein